MDWNDTVQQYAGHRDRDRKVARFTTTYAISTYHKW
jgi:hypothetical protein